ncbi:hypothetical protein [Nostoc sp. FACHB-133]|nr:hypothetical protein [Nostoc sp. FACHB-133]MBD2527366.1 hypothetical protein [Nostoc sp. FACHB-133]
MHFSLLSLGLSQLAFKIFVRTDDEAIAPATNHCNRPTVVCISRRKV